MMYKKMKEWEIGYERDEGVSLLGLLCGIARRRAKQ